MSKKVFNEIKNLVTESKNKETASIDSASPFEIAKLINNEDKKCALEVENHLEKIANAISLLEKTFRNGGRLFYIGAGTSGRLGVLDASECPPTYGTNPEMVQGVIAGGYETLIRSKEGIEDEFLAGWHDLEERNINENDVLCGIMASGRTPYVVGAIEEAQKRNISTIILTANPCKNLKIKADINICLNAGAEVVRGSTRMKAGTMQKMVLNMMTTGAMIRIGKVYGNTMIDVEMTSKKLEERAKGLVMEFCDLDYNEAEKLLKSAHGHVKSAIAMYFTRNSFEEIQKKFKNSSGRLSDLI
jgi:N-acetylmuramic acid 6-phosphate etherase